MDSISTLLGGHAAPQTIEHEGRTYRCGALTQVKKTAFERAMVSRIKSFCESEAEKDRITERAASGEYSFVGKASNDFRSTYDGFLLLVGVLFDLPSDEAESLVLERAGDVSGAVALSLLESLPKTKREEAIRLWKEAREKAEREATQKDKPKGLQPEASEEAPLPR